MSVSPDFTQKTVTTLAKRVNFRCSNPHCRRPTSGPHEDPEKATTVGEAAHIRDARFGTSRYDPDMTDAQRRHIDNAIWLCSKCHTMIDANPDRYPVKLLLEWKAQAQQRAQDELEGKLPPPERVRLPFALHNLPPRPEVLEARDALLEKILPTLAPGEIVTLLGPGGVGKSALAAELLWRLTNGLQSPPEQFPDGVVWHSFYNQPSTDAAFQALAQAYQVEVVAAGNPDAAARQALHGRTALLVLDGAEAAENLDAVLALRGRCGILLTTRNEDQAGVTCFDVPLLDQTHSVSVLKTWGRRWASDEPEILPQIVELIDGLPLALELAGKYMGQRRQRASEYLAWLQSTPLQALHHGEHQKDSVDILLQRSLAALSDDARAALGALGLLSQAPMPTEILAAALDRPPDETARQLGDLSAFGLARRQGDQWAVSHRLVHTYARRKVDPPTEAAARLVEYFEQLFQEQVPLGAPGMARLTALKAHPLALLERLHTLQDWSLLLRLAWGLDDYFFNSGLAREWRQIAHLALIAAEESGEKYDQSSWLQKLGLSSARLGDARQAIDYYEQSLAIAQEIGDRRIEGNALGNLGNAYYYLGDARQAIDYHKQALAIAREIGDRRAEGKSLGSLGTAYYALGDARQAIDYHKQALAISQEIGDRRGEGHDLGNLGSAYADLGETRQAIAYYEKALVIAQEIGDRRGEGHDLGNLGNTYADLRDARQAIDYYQQALAIAQEIGDRRAEGYHLGNLGLAYAELGDARQAIEYHQQALAIAQEIGDRRGEGNQLNNLGVVYENQGELETAIDHFQQALAIAQDIGDRSGEGTRLRNLGDCYKALDQIDRARLYYQQSLAIFDSLQLPHADEVRQLLQALEKKKKKKLKKIKKNKTS